MKFRLLITCCCLVWTAFCQDPYPALTSRLNGCKDSSCLPLIRSLYNDQQHKNPAKTTSLQLWYFYVCDSLGLAHPTDSLCGLLLKKSEVLNYPVAVNLFRYRGSILVDSSAFQDAIHAYYQGLKIAQKWRITSSEGLLQRLIGLAYLKLDEHKKAESHLRSSLQIFESIHDDKGIANACISLGNALKEQGKVKESIVYYERSLKLAQKIGNKRLIAGNYNNLGNAMRRLKRQREALRYFFKALEMNEKSGNKLWISFNYHNIGNTYNDLKQYDKAIPYFLKSNAIKRELGDSLSLVTGYFSLSESYAGIGDYKDAFRYLSMHQKLEDTLRLIEQATMLNELETQYETARKEAEIRQLKTESDLRAARNHNLQQRAEKIRNYFILSGIAVIFLIIGLLFLFRTNRVRQRANALLHEKNLEVEKSNNALQLALSELSVKNREIIDSINYATYIQQATLPNITQHSTDLLRFELFFAPKDIVSGDFYFSYQLHHKSVFGVADCTGHGVPGAMVSLVGMNSLDKVVREENHSSSAAMVTSLNTHVLDSLHRGGDSINDGMDISFCYLDHETLELHFTGANHNGFVLRKRQEVTETGDYALITLPGTRRPIGKTSSLLPFSESTIQLEKGDRIILFSDGYADQTGAATGKKMKRAYMMDLLLQSAHLDTAAQVTFMREQFLAWKSHSEQVDDVCLLIVGVKD